MKKNLIISFLVVVVIILGLFLLKPKPSLENDMVVAPEGETEEQQIKDTYTYTNHGFSIELPKGFVATETKDSVGSHTYIAMPGNTRLVYVIDSAYWENNVLSNYDYLKDETIGNHTFKVYGHDDEYVFWYKKGDVGYAFYNGDKELLKTFKFVGWPQEAKCENEWCVDELAPTNITSMKPTTYQSIGITENELKALVTKEFGDCTGPETCQNRTIEVMSAEVKIGESIWNNYIVIATFNGLGDDSVAAEKVISKIYQNASGDGIWRLSEPASTWRCQPGRGHQDFNTDSCI